MTLDNDLRIHRLVAIVRLSDHGHALAISDVLVAGGVRFIEVTVEHPDGLASVAAIWARHGRHVHVGAGTVLTAEMAHRVAASGASFIVTPNTNISVIAAAKEASLVVFAGAFTPSEAQNAHEAGADYIKMFPATTGGVQHLKAISAPLAHLKFVPTGGVTPGNAAQWLTAGAFAVAMGSSVVPSTDSLNGLEQRVKSAVEATTQQLA